MKIAVYCSSREGLHDKFTMAATKLGQWIGTHRHTLVYGGVKAGLMHTVAQSVHDAGGELLGIVPTRFLYRADPLLNTMMKCDDLGDRKTIMMNHADVFVVLPGGIGTIDEWISTLSQVIVNNGDDRKILVLNTDGMYDAQVQQLNETAKSVFARGKHIDMSINCPTVEKMIVELEKIQNDDEK